MTSDVKINPCYFNELYESEHRNKSDLIILYGGASSGKSYYVLGQHIPLSFAKEEKRNWLILRKVNRTVKKSVYTEFKKGIQTLGIEGEFKENKSEQTFTHKSGYQVIFAGLDDREKIKSITPAKGVFTDIVMEEATEFDEQDYKQLEKRLRGKTEYKKQIWFLFNPIHVEHWIYKKFFNDWVDKRYDDGTYHIQNYEIEKRKVLIMRVTHVDNEELTDDDRYRLENETDDYMYDVYTLGKFGVVGELIFTNWVKADLSEIPRDRLFHGLDFGFYPDPNAYVQCAINKNKKELYILNEWIGYKMDNEDIAHHLKDYVKNDILYADSAEPKSIKELKNYGLYTKAVKKGQGSIETGIKYLQKYKIIVDYKCKNVIRELSLYQNKKDKNGNVLPVPEDQNNHFIDALRYALNPEIMGGTGVTALRR